MALSLVTGPVSIWVTIPVLTVVPVDATVFNFSSSQSSASSSGAGVNPGTGIGITPRAFSVIKQKAVFLGTSRNGPRVVKRRAYVPVHNDISGAIIPFDNIWAGEEAFIFADMTRWNESVYQTIAATSASAFPGVDGPGSRGTLMMTEGAGYGLILRYPHYDQHPIFRANGMLAGERYLCGYLWGEDTHEPGNKANMRSLAWYAQSVYSPGSNSLALYDSNVGNIPALIPD